MASPVGRRKASKKLDEVDTKGAVTMDRGLQVLSAFTKEDPRLSLVMLAERTGLNKATLLRFLESLKRCGLVDQSPSGLYHVGPASLVLFGLYRSAVSESDAILATLSLIVERTGESASFSIPDGDRRIVSFRVQSAHRIRDHVEVGDTFPLGVGAPGRVLKSFVSVGASELQEVSDRCVAISHGEVEPDASAVAVPVFRAAAVAGAIALTGPSSRITADRIEQFVPLLLECAIKLTMRLEGDYTGLQKALSQRQSKKKTERSL